MEFKVGNLLYNAKGGSLFRVVAVGTDSMHLIEYNRDITEFDPKCYSLIKEEWYRWKNDGTGEKITFSSMGLIAPNKIPQSVHTFKQLEGASSLIIKGASFKVVSDNTLVPPEKWQGHQIFYLMGKKPAMLSLETLERKSMMDRAANCEFFIDGNITRLSETDIVIIMEA